MAVAFSIRRYAETIRGTPAADLGPFDLAARDLPPMEVRIFRWWEHEVAALKSAAAADDEEEEATGNGRTPKKRSITDLFAAAPAVDGDGAPSAAEDDEEVLCSIVRRSKQMRRKRRQEEAAADEPESSAAAERRAAEGNFARKKPLYKPNLGDGLDTPDESEEHEVEYHVSTEREKIPDLKRRKHGRLNNSLQKKKAERLKHIGGRKAFKVGKQRDIKKLPLPSILKKYTKHTSVKMVKEKLGNSKGPGVIELCRKSIKRVKFSEANDALGSKKQCSERPQLDSFCKLLSDVMTSSSSSSIEMSSEEEHIIAESRSSRMPGKAFTMAKEPIENTNKDNQSDLSSTGLSTALFDLNQPLSNSDPADLNSLYVPNPEETYLQHTQIGTRCMDQQVFDNGRTNHKDSSFNPNGQEQQEHATDLDNRTKSPCRMLNQTIQDSVQLQNWCSMTMHHGVSGLSTGGDPSSFQFQGCNLSHSEKQIFHSEMNIQQESRPHAGQTLRLMGRDLTVSNTRVDYLPEAAQKHTNPTEDHLTTKVVLELPRQGQPFLSLQTQSIPNVSASFASTRAHVSATPASPAQVHFRNRTNNVSHPLPAANVLSGDPSRYEDSWRDLMNLQSHRNVLLGCPPLSNHASDAFLQNSPTAWRYYSDHSTKTDLPSAPFSPTNMQHVTPSSDYRANLPAPYGFYSASSSVHPHNSANFVWSHPDQIIEGVPDSRTSATLPSRTARTGAVIADADNPTSSSSRFVLRSGPVKLSPGAKHILIPSENTEDDNSAPVYSCVSFGSSGGNASVPRQNKGAGSRRF